jgi:hypothetical protein
MSVRTTKWFVYSLTEGYLWPSQERAYTFEGIQILYRPETEGDYADLSLEVGLNEDKKPYIALFNRFLTILSWIYDKELNSEGNGCATFRARKTKPKFGKFIGSDLESIPTITDPDQLFALALYRNAMGIDYPPLKFAEYWRIFEIKKPGMKLINWINEQLLILKNTNGMQGCDAFERLQELHSENNSMDIGNYLKESCRHASVHARVKPIVNPDNPVDPQRLANEIPLVKYLAEIYIEKVLGVNCRNEVKWIPSDDWLRENRGMVDNE